MTSPLGCPGTGLRFKRGLGRPLCHACLCEVEVALGQDATFLRVELPSPPPCFLDILPLPWHLRKANGKAGHETGTGTSRNLLYGNR